MDLFLGAVVGSAAGDAILAVIFGAIIWFARRRQQLVQSLIIGIWLSVGISIMFRLATNSSLIGPVPHIIGGGLLTSLVWLARGLVEKGKEKSQD